VFIIKKMTGQGAGTRSRNLSQILFPDPKLTFKSHKMFTQKNSKFKINPSIIYKIKPKMLQKLQILANILMFSLPVDRNESFFDLTLKYTLYRRDFEDFKININIVFLNQRCFDFKFQVTLFVIVMKFNVWTWKTWIVCICRDM